MIHALGPHSYEVERMGLTNQQMRLVLDCIEEVNREIRVSDKGATPPSTISFFYYKRLSGEVKKAISLTYLKVGWNGAVWQGRLFNLSR